MRKLLALLLVATLLGMGTPARAEVISFNDALERQGEAAPPPGEAAPEATAAARGDEPFVIGATTKLSGMFFTNMWGNNTCDIDVRSLIHGYSPVVWTQQAQYEVNEQIVHGLSVGDYDNGNKVYMITLHKDLTYNDGSPIQAADYVFSLMLYASPVIRALGGITTNSGYIAGSDAYLAGETETFTGLRIIDPYTFTIEIKKEFLPFFYELSMLHAFPYPIDVIAPGCEVVDDGNGARIQNIDQSRAEPLFTEALLRETVLDPDTGYLSHPSKTSGPYRLTAFDWDTRTAEFKINTYFKGTHDGARPTVDNLVFKAVLPETMIEEYTSGEVQLLNKCVAGETIEEGLALVAGGEAVSANYPRLGFGFLSFSCEKGPCQFEAVRQAIAYAIDEEAFCRDFSQYSIPVYGYMGIGQWMYLATASTPDPDIPIAEDTQKELSLDGLNHYTKDFDAARALLIEDGWVLNGQGNAYDETVDSVRCKEVDGALMPLSIQWVKMEDSIATEILTDALEEGFAEIGAELAIVDMPFVDLLEEYYNPGEREMDMVYLATNFTSVFDPYFVFNTQDGYQGTQNTTGYRDEKLEALALALRQTEPGDLAEYCRRWIAFQTYWNEKLPMLPLYSNVYFDFHVPGLINYHPDGEMNWPVAIVYAYLEGDEPQWLAAAQDAASAAQATSPQQVNIDD